PALTRLIHKSLVGADTTGAEARYRMLETIREYARARLAARSETAASGARHLRYYQALAEQAPPELTGARQQEWLTRLEADHDNLRAALAWAIEQASAEFALRLAGALWRFWWVRGHLSEGRRWLEAALALADQALGDAAATRDAPGAPLLELRATALNGA